MVRGGVEPACYYLRPKSCLHQERRSGSAIFSAGAGGRAFARLPRASLVAVSSRLSQSRSSRSSRSRCRALSRSAWRVCRSLSRVCACACPGFLAIACPLSRAWPRTTSGRSVPSAGRCPGSLSRVAGACPGLVMGLPVTCAQAARSPGSTVQTSCWPRRSLLAGRVPSLILRLTVRSLVPMASAAWRIVSLDTGVLRGGYSGCGSARRRLASTRLHRSGFRWKVNMPVPSCWQSVR